MDKAVIRIIRPDGQVRTLERTDPDKPKPDRIVRIGRGVPPQRTMVRSEFCVQRSEENVERKTQNESPHQPITDKDFEQLIIRQGELYRQRSKLSNQLVDIAFDSTQAERSVIVDQILAKVSEYNKLAEAKRFFEKHGKWPEAPAEKKKAISDTEKQELLRTIQNIRSNISKAKKAIERYQHQPVKVQKYMQKKVRLETELQYAEELIRN